MHFTLMKPSFHWESHFAYNYKYQLLYRLAGAGWLQCKSTTKKHLERSRNLFSFIIIIDTVVVLDWQEILAEAPLLLFPLMHSQAKVADLWEMLLYFFKPRRQEGNLDTEGRTTSLSRRQLGHRRNCYISFKHWITLMGEDSRSRVLLSVLLTKMKESRAWMQKCGHGERCPKYS